LTAHSAQADPPDSTNGAKRRLDEILQKLKERDLRLTPQRLAVLKVLVSSETHPSVEGIYELVKTEFPTTSLATIYKTVTLLKELGEVLELGFPDGSNRYDGRRPYPHPHVVCTGCGAILDSEIVSLATETEEVSRRTGYTVRYHRLEFFGLCPECQRRSSNT
jgi:Fur family transcriptional regulator, peroxide stress response regulator